jgi:error-prone DNA polymerase
MSMLPRLKPKTFWDLVIEVAIVRPGPIQGDMVHPYLRRRQGLEPVHYPSEELRQVLAPTLGVPLFQEQAMRVAIVCAGFTPAEADQLRRAMATFKHSGGVAWFRDKLVDGMVRRGYARDFAERTFRQIEGFGSYGFPESHAASFALIAYASSWMKCHHPDVFCAALLNAQPMGFYAPAQIVRDAQRHGVEVRPVDVNHSRWDCTLEKGPGPRLAVRLGLRLVRGLANADAAAIVAARGGLPYATVAEVGRRAGVGRGALERIAAADGFGSLLPGRRRGLWAVRAVEGPPLPLFAAADAREGRPRPLATEPEVPLPPMRPGAEVVADYRAAGLSLRGHPLAFLRARLQARGLVRCADLRFARDGEQVRLAGLVLVRQRPGTARGVTFITIEDETEVANLVVWADMAVRCRGTISAALLGVAGRVQREGEVIHVVARRLADLSSLLIDIGGDPPAAGPHLRVAARDFR